MDRIGVARFAVLVCCWLFLTPLVAWAQADVAEVSRGASDTPLLALTFDAGGVAGSAERVISTLGERGLRVTFFLSGRWVETYPELVAHIAADGHELANHSYSHADFRTLSNDSIAWELEHTDELIASAAGRDPVPMYRPPFGSRDRRVLLLTESLGYRSVMWALDSADWRVEATASGVARRVLSYAEPGDIVVMHIASEATAEALATILDGVQDRGLQVVTVSELLAGEVAPRRDRP